MKIFRNIVLVLLGFNVLALILVFIRLDVWWMNYVSLFGSVLFGWHLREMTRRDYD